MTLLHQALTDKIIASAYSVQRILGPGFVEKIYEEALAIELVRDGLAVSRQRRVNIVYRGKMIGWHRLDLIVEGLVVLELKVVRSIEPIHRAIVRSYLKATGIPLGLILSFATPDIAIARVICTPDRSSGEPDTDETEGRTRRTGQAKVITFAAPSEPKGAQ